MSHYTRVHYWRETVIKSNGMPVVYSVCGRKNGPHGILTTTNKADVTCTMCKMIMAGREV